jgi:hypothetical protein
MNYIFYFVWASFQIPLGIIMIFYSDNESYQGLFVFIVGVVVIISGVSNIPLGIMERNKKQSPMSRGDAI